MIKTYKKKSKMILKAKHHKFDTEEQIAKVVERSDSFSIGNYPKRLKFF